MQRGVARSVSGPRPRLANDMTSAPVPAAESSAEARPGGLAGKPAGRAGLTGYLPAAAGVAYLVACVVGLSVWPKNLALNASAGQAAAAYAAHPAQAAVQFLLVE